MRRLLAICGLALCLLASAVPALADKRVALLIGNSNYAAVGALANPRNDALLLKSALDAAGFDEVRTAFDLGQRDMVKALRAPTKPPTPTSRWFIIPATAWRSAASTISCPSTRRSPPTSTCPTKPSRSTACCRRSMGRSG